jgi:hypothetical protein
VVAGTTREGAALASVRSLGVFSACHCGGGHDRCGRCSGHHSLSRRGLSLPLWWRARQLIALLWSLFARSAWAQPATLVAGTTVEGAALASVRSVRVGSASHSLWRTRQVRALLWPLIDRSAWAQSLRWRADMQCMSVPLSGCICRIICIFERRAKWKYYHEM